MSDTHAGYVVVLEEPLHEEDSERVVAAISLLKGVVSVKPVVDSFELQLAYDKAKHEIGMKLFQELKKVLWGGDIQ
jgi:hypothetical protein